MILLDTSGLLPVIDERQHRHAECVKALQHRVDDALHFAKFMPIVAHHLAPKRRTSQGTAHEPAVTPK